MTSAQPVPGRPLRADAQRNRARVVAAAEAVFAERGPSASTDEVARQAGVAIGTVFRHFPTKEALIEAVLAHRLRALVDEAESLASAGDPAAAFFGFLTRLAELSTTKHAYADALADTGADVAAVIGTHSRAVQELVRTLDGLLTRAQRAGAVRGDVGVAELRALLIGTSRVAEHTGPDEALRARTLAIVFDGLRPPDRR